MPDVWQDTELLRKPRTPARVRPCPLMHGAKDDHDVRMCAF
ncbi:hypothetical protein [Streptomyces malaysiensis]|nr:hypothetical protein [Streptomyces sp. SPMA113]